MFTKVNTNSLLLPPSTTAYQPVNQVVGFTLSEVVNYYKLIYGVGAFQKIALHVSMGILWNKVGG